MSNHANYNNNGLLFSGIAAIHVITVEDASGDYDFSVPTDCFIALAWFFKTGNTGGVDDTVQLKSVTRIGDVSNVSDPQSLEGTTTGSLIAFPTVNMTAALLEEKGLIRVSAIKTSDSVSGVMVILVAPRQIVQ